MTDSWRRVAEFPAGFDTLAIETALHDAGIDFTLRPSGQGSELLIPHDENPESVVAVVQAVLADARRNPLQGAGQTSFKAGLAGQFRRTPVMVLCLALSLLGAALVHWQFQWVHWLTFQDFTLLSPNRIGFASFAQGMEQGQYWRLLTPIFLHFGIFHIAFNGLWLWEFGKRIEVVAGSGHFLMLVVVSGVVSNYSQYVWGGPSLFGGMSGVLYALLGYIWIRNSLTPNPVLALPNGIIVFMLGWLVLCMTGVVDLIMRGSIANAAHFSGLLVGMVLGAAFGLAGRNRR